MDRTNDEMEKSRAEAYLDATEQNHLERIRELRQASRETGERTRRLRSFIDKRVPPVDRADS